MNGTEQKERGTQIYRLDKRVDSVDARMQELAEAWDAEIKEQVDKLHSNIVDGLTAEGRQRQQELESAKETFKLQLEMHCEHTQGQVRDIWNDKLTPFFHGLTFWGRLRWLFTGTIKVSSSRSNTRLQRAK